MLKHLANVLGFGDQGRFWDIDKDGFVFVHVSSFDGGGGYFHGRGRIFGRPLDLPDE